jgi:hypothetical protein
MYKRSYCEDRLISHLCRTERVRKQTVVIRVNMTENGSGTFMVVTL